MAQIIPIDSTKQTQKFEMTIGGVVYKFKLLWNNTLEYWTIYISTRDDVPLVSGKNLTGGTELMNQYNIPITNMYLVNLADNKKELPKDQVGLTGYLVLYSEEEIQQVLINN